MIAPRRFRARVHRPRLVAVALAACLSGCMLSYDVSYGGPSSEELLTEEASGLRLRSTLSEGRLELTVEQLMTRTYRVTTDREHAVELRLREEGLLSLFGEPDNVVVFLLLLPFSLLAATVDVTTLVLSAPVMLSAAALAGVDPGLEITSDVRISGEPLSAGAEVQVALGELAPRPRTLTESGSLSLEAGPEALRALEAGRTLLIVSAKAAGHAAQLELGLDDLIALAASPLRERPPAAQLEAWSKLASRFEGQPRELLSERRRELERSLSQGPQGQRSAEAERARSAPDEGDRRRTSRLRGRLEIVWQSLRAGTPALLDAQDLSELLTLGTPRAREVVASYRARWLGQAAARAVREASASATLGFGGW